MTCIYDFLGYYTLSGMTVSENRARSKCFLNNFNMKANRNRCLLNICCDRHCTNFDTSFLHIGSLPGVFLWRGVQGKGPNDCTCCVLQQSVWLSCPLSTVELLLTLLVHFSPRACLPYLSIISLLGHFLTINLVFAFLELLPAASFGVHNAYQSVAGHTL